MQRRLAEHRGTAVTTEAIEFVRGPYGSAVDAGSSPKHAVEILEQQLADADRISRRSGIRGNVLGDALPDRTHRIADLEVRLSQLEADRGAERKRADELAAAHPDVSGLLQERNALQLEVERLGSELREARAQRAAAEDRCNLLERRLDAVEKSTASLPAATTPQDMPLAVLDITAHDEATAPAVIAALEQRWATSGITVMRREAGPPGVSARVHAGSGASDAGGKHKDHPSAGPPPRACGHTSRAHLRSRSGGSASAATSRPVASTGILIRTSG
ncbi:DUF6207 family protein [Streptomyces atratus]|uniref:DUF6207 family protein n=1 Tax=Streptomyces atratus TaxID=1893 RepID=UPI001E391E56|nr:DUF6207 family protein [Streptomyces atratus]